jgi:uncharacterized cupredoxin-like copper-binding protein
VRASRLPLTIAAAVVVLAGCADGSIAGSDDRVAAAGVAIDHEVVLVEKAFGVASRWTAGPQVLAVRNEGGAHHNLILCPGDERGCAEGGGVGMDVLVKPQVRDPDAFPARTSSLIVGAGADAVVRTDPLEPGTYRLWCGIPLHAERGMQRVIEVAAG